MKAKTLVALALLGGAWPASAASGCFANIHFLTSSTGGTHVANPTSGVDSAATVFGFNGSGSAAAGFTLIPEPTSAIIGLIGSVLLLRRRR